MTTAARHQAPPASVLPFPWLDAPRSEGGYAHARNPRPASPPRRFGRLLAPVQSSVPGRGAASARRAPRRTSGGERFADVGLLLVSELVTHAVLHGTPAGNRVELVLSVDHERLRIEVHDARADQGPVLRAASVGDEGGRGLILVKSLSLRWGCCPRRGIGKIVWAECGPEAAPPASLRATAEGCAV
ncbi:ATP-binding protein [Kitasatospora sp. NPDC091207]|uniref:ATP-binding protein n=1 Tax=Kitasatospora sp. NPDC091207 TaxID=3364083 RepID=UPI0037FF4874